MKYLDQVLSLLLINAFKISIVNQVWRFSLVNKCGLTLILPSVPTEPCVCRVTGDPILESSDGLLQSLIGPAKYVLSRLESDPPSACDHSVSIIFTDKNGNR